MTALQLVPATAPTEPLPTQGTDDWKSVARSVAVKAKAAFCLTNSNGKVVPVRLVGEQHVSEDLGRIPSFADWARLIQPAAWILRGNPIDAPTLDARS